MKKRIKDICLGEDETVDYAKPQGWVNAANELGIDTWMHVIHYPKDGGVFGKSVDLPYELCKKISENYILEEVVLSLIELSTKESKDSKNLFYKIYELITENEDRTTKAS